MTDDLQHLTHETLDYLISVAGEANVSTRGADLDQHTRDQFFTRAACPPLWSGRSRRKKLAPS